MTPEEFSLETILNEEINGFVVRFSCPEFTSKCPLVGQPDYARFYIDYIPGPALVESKSLKLFLQSFRDHDSFHEECTMLVYKKLVEALNPHWLRVTAFWFPRGGIPIDIFVQTGVPPAWAYIPTLDPNQLYKGR